MESSELKAFHIMKTLSSEFLYGVARIGSTNLVTALSVCQSVHLLVCPSVSLFVCLLVVSLSIC